MNKSEQEIETLAVDVARNVYVDNPTWFKDELKQLLSKLHPQRKPAKAGSLLHCPWCDGPARLTEIKDSPTNPFLVSCEMSGKSTCPMSLAMTPEEWNSRAAADAAPLPDKQEQPTCVKCGHLKFRSIETGRCRELLNWHEDTYCGCKCEFAPTQEQQPTPRQLWRSENNERFRPGQIIVEDLFDGQGGVSVVAHAFTEANARLIVTAVNAHDKYEKALRQLQNTGPGAFSLKDYREYVRAVCAEALAEG